MEDIHRSFKQAQFDHKLIAGTEIVEIEQF